MAPFKSFDPQDYCLPASAKESPGLGDQRKGRVYVWDDDIKLHVNIALAANRPLLITGPSGCGKSSLAAFIARFWQSRYYEYVVTGHSRAQDLMWHFDAVRRLGDAQTKKLDEVREKHGDFPYIEPGVLWWIIDPTSAKQRGFSNQNKPKFKALTDDDQALDPANRLPWTPQEKQRPVLLIDEIDKAEPDFANNLLVPFGSYQFHVRETKIDVSFAGGPSETAEPLIIITSNQDRDLPEAFERRCVHYHMALPKEEGQFKKIAQHTFKAEAPEVFEKYDKIINDFTAKILNYAKSAKKESRRECSIPEYLDILRACYRLQDEPNSEAIFKAVLGRADFPGGTN